MTQAHRYDAIVIGGGHNGLVNAAYLARAGKRVLVLERRHLVGGAAVTEELYPGFKYSVCSYVVSLLRPEIVRDLDLAAHGLEILPLENSFSPGLNGDHLVRWADHDLTRKALYGHSPRDAEAIVNRFFENLTEALARGEGIEIRGFGSFGVKHRPVRERRNPKTGAMVSLAASKAPFFKVSKELRLRVNGKRPATTG